MAEETAVMDAPVAESAPVSSGESSSQADISHEEPLELTPQQETPKPDNRRNPDSMRKALKWLRENGQEHSEQAKHLEAMLGEMKSWKTVAPTVREGREMKMAVDAAGGVQKIAEMQQSVAHMAEVDSMLEAGDPKVLDEIFETAAAGVAKLAPEILSRLSKANPQAYRTAIEPHAIGFLDSEGVTDAIDEMVKAFNAGKPEDAKGWLARLVNWYKAKASEQGRPEAAPEQTAREKEYSAKEQKLYEREVQAVFDRVIPHAETSIRAKLDADAKRLGMSPAHAQLMLEDVWKIIERKRNAHPAFRAMLGQKFNDRNHSVSEDAATFLQGFTTELLDDAYQTVMGPRLRAYKPGSPSIPAKVSPVEAPAGGGPLLDTDVTRKKLGRNGAQDAILRGEGFDKTGKKIKRVGKTWRYA